MNSTIAVITRTTPKIKLTEKPNSDKAPPRSIPEPIPTSQPVRYVALAVARREFGARLTNRVLNAGNIVPKPYPKHSAARK